MNGGTMVKRFLAAMTAAVAVVGGSLTTVASPAHALDATYVHLQIYDGQSGLCLNPRGSFVAGAAVYADDCRTSAGAYWQITNLGNDVEWGGNGYHIVRSQFRPDLCLTAPAWNNYYLMLYPCANPTGSPYWDQQWRIRYTEGTVDELPFTAALSTRSDPNKCVTGPKWTSRRALTYTCTWLADQRWRFWGG
jgi:Ricin-type beta-trefoil lectin domain